MNKDSINAEMRLNKAEYDPQKFLIVADSFFYAAEICSNSWKLEEIFPKVQIAIFIIAMYQFLRKIRMGRTLTGTASLHFFRFFQMKLNKLYIRIITG